MRTLSDAFKTQTETGAAGDAERTRSVPRYRPETIGWLGADLKRGVVLRNTKKKRLADGDGERSAFAGTPVFGRGWQGWCAVAGGVAIEAFVACSGLKPPPDEALGSPSDQLDRCMRLRVFLYAMKYGVGLLSTPGSAMVTTHVTRARSSRGRG